VRSDNPAAPARGRLWLPAAVWLGSSAVLLLHALSYLSFISDDALISLRYARRLLDGHGLTWTAGERVEGYSNLLWVLLCAGLGRLGLDLIVAARVLGLVGSTIGLSAILRVGRCTASTAALPAVAAGLAFALSGPVAVWSVGGLEQPLIAASLGLALVLLLPIVDAPDPGASRRIWGAAIPLALLCWTRPDGALFTVAACAGLLAARGASRTSLLACSRLALVPGVFYFSQLAFRLAYYGEWFPNSAHAKLALTLHRLREGLFYLGGGALWLIGLVLPALLLSVLACRDERSARRVRFLLAPLLIWSAYVAFVGGDIFPARRHWVPQVVVLALLLFEGLVALERRGDPSRRAAWIVAGLSLVVLGGMQQLDPQNRRARAERWEWDGAAIGKLLRDAFAEHDPVLAADPAGTLPYFSGLRSIDMLGTNDHHMARHRPPDFGHGPLGHELGDGGYVLDREPDLVVFCGPSGGARPCFRSGREMIADPRFRLLYRLVQFEADQPHPLRARIWVRAEGGPLGVEREPRRVRVPGYLLMANPSSVARFDPAGALATVVEGGAPAGLAALQLGPGVWQLRVEPIGQSVETQVRATGSRQVLARGAGELSFTLSAGGPGAVDLLIAPAAADPCYVRSIVFEMQPAEVIDY
jgi:hypothetical protein